MFIMSKRIVVKSVIAVVMAGFVLSLSSCKKDEKKIIGTWKYDKVEVKEITCSNPLLNSMLKSFAPQALGAYLSSVDGEIEFTKDGKAMYRSTGNTATYKVNDSKLTITNNITNIYELSFPDKKTMQWEQDMDRYYLELISDLIEANSGYEIRITKCSYREILKKQE